MTATVAFNLTWMAGVIGFFLPLLISLFKKATWSQRTKKIFALVVSAVAGVVNVGMQAGWVFSTIGEFVVLAVYSIIDVYVVASVLYKSFWEGSAPETKLAEV